MASSGSSGHLVCEGCGSTDFSQNQEGFYVCNDCLTQSQEYVEQHLDYTDTTGHKGRAIRKPKAAPEQEPLENLEACYPGSKGTFLDYFQELLLRQVEALVSDCGVNPMITDLVRKLWFRYLVIRDNRIANNDSFHLRLRIWKENQAETPTKNAKNKTKSGQNVEEAKTWLEEMGLSSMLQKQEEEEEEEEDEEEEEGEEEKRGKKRERKKKKPWEPRKRRGAMSSKRKVVELESSVDLPQLSLTIALNYVACNILQEPIVAMDFIQWVRSGRIPYEEIFTHTDFKDVVSCKPMYQLTARKVDTQASFLVRTLNLEQVLLPFYPVLYRFIKELCLPSSLGQLIHNMFQEMCMGKTEQDGIMAWLYEHAARHKHDFTARVLASIVVALKLVYGCGGTDSVARYEPAHPHDQYRALLSQKTPPKKRNTGASQQPWYSIPPPGPGTLFSEMPAFSEWKWTMRNLLFRHLPSGSIPFLISDFWRIGPNNLNDYIEFIQSLYDPTPEGLVPMAKQLNHTFESCGGIQNEPEEKQPSTKSALNNTKSRKPPKVEASQFFTYQKNTWKIREWDNTSWHAEYRDVIEMISAFYELMHPFYLHNAVKTLEKMLTNYSKKSAEPQKGNGGMT